MKNLLVAVTLLGGAVLATAPAAEAAFMFTDATFFTVGSPGTFTFTYLGFSAADTDTMHFVLNGQTIFINNATPVGTQVTIPVTAAGTYKLDLVDTSVPATWSSDPSQNSDGADHLAITSTFSDFHLGTVPNVPGNSTPFYGWEDRAFPGADADYNDLVFTETFAPATVPEPATLALLGTGLLGIGAAVRRKRT